MSPEVRHSTLSRRVSDSNFREKKGGTCVKEKGQGDAPLLETRESGGVERLHRHR